MFFWGGWFPQQWRLTNDDSVVGSLVDGAVKLDDVAVAEHAEDFSLTHTQRIKQGFLRTTADF